MSEESKNITLYESLGGLVKDVTEIWIAGIEDICSKLTPRVKWFRPPLSVKVFKWYIPMAWAYKVTDICEYHGIAKGDVNMSRIDKQFGKIGFTKASENEHGVYYQRYNEKHKYTQVVCIIRKNNGNHLVQSYQEEVNSDKFNNVVGLNYREMRLLVRKYRQMKSKYHWK